LNKDPIAAHPKQSQELELANCDAAMFADCDEIEHAMGHGAVQK
jgi:hypothetical protein